MEKSATTPEGEPQATKMLAMPAQLTAAEEQEFRTRVIKKAKRGVAKTIEHKNPADDQAEQQKTSEGSEEVLLVRVRRRTEAEPLEALELSFDRANQLKRRRFVTQSDALIAKFEASLSVKEDQDAGKEEGRALQASAHNKVNHEEETKSGFTLGARVKTETKASVEKGGRSVTLRRLMPNTAGKSLEEIRKFHTNLISQRLQARRQKQIEEKRKELFKGAPMTFDAEKVCSNSPNDDNVEEEKKATEDNLKIIDLENLATGQGGHDMTDGEADSNIAYDYFVCVKKDGKIYDIEHDQVALCDNDGEDSDHDSEDSNRESASANDYPDEDIDIGSDSDVEGFRGCDDDSDDSRRRRRRRRNRHGSSDSEIDEEEAARRYNAKHNTSSSGNPSWLDRLQRKVKHGATEGHTIKEMLQSQMRDGYDQDYDSEEDRYRMQIEDDDDDDYM